MVIFILITILSITCHKKRQSTEPYYHTYETVDGTPLARNTARGQPEAGFHLEHNAAYDRAQAKTAPADISTPVAETTYEEPVVEADYEVMEGNP